MNWTRFKRSQRWENTKNGVFFKGEGFLFSENVCNLNVRLKQNTKWLPCSFLALWPYSAKPIKVLIQIFYFQVILALFFLLLYELFFFLQTLASDNTKLDIRWKSK